MRYFFALKINAMVHRAVTRLHMNQVVQVDLTREEVFKKYDEMPELLVFKNKDDIKEQIRSGSVKAVPQGGTFRQFQPSNMLFDDGDQINAEDVLVVYQLEVDEAALGRSDDKVTISSDEKRHVKLQAANVGNCNVFLTDDYAREQQTSSVISLINPDHLLVKKPEPVTTPTMIYGEY